MPWQLPVTGIIGLAAVCAASTCFASPNSGMPLGNGRMGTLVWTTPDAVEFQINRVDVFAVNRDAQGKRFGADGSSRESNTDYGGGCGRVSVIFGGEAFRAAAAPQLSLAEARCHVRGEAVRVACWVAAEADALVVEVTDEREPPQPGRYSSTVGPTPASRRGSPPPAATTATSPRSCTRPTNIQAPIPGSVTRHHRAPNWRFMPGGATAIRATRPGCGLPPSAAAKSSLLKSRRGWGRSAASAIPGRTRAG